MNSVPVRLDDDIIRKIDILIAKGKYKNRSEALRDQIIRGLENISLIEESDEKSEEYELILKKMLSLEKSPNLLKTKKSVINLVAEGRER